MKNSRSLRMNPHSSVPAKSGAAAGRDGGGLGITAIAVIAALLVGMIGIFDVAAGAAPQIGESAPDFTAVDAEGNPIRLSQYRGKTVVLEWTNADCPYARRQYSTGNMQSVQALAQKDGIVWLTVISPAPGKLRAVNGAAADALTVSRHAEPTAVLLDPTGSVARMYAANTTPQMFVIDKHGMLRYMGGMDSIAITGAADIARAEPYLKEAMLAVAAGDPAPHAVTQPHGCSIEY